MTRTSWNNKKNCLLCSVLVNMDQQKKVINNKYLKILYSPIWIWLKFSVNFFIHFIPFRSDKTKKFVLNHSGLGPARPLRFFFSASLMHFTIKKKAEGRLPHRPPPSGEEVAPPPPQMGRPRNKKEQKN